MRPPDIFASVSCESLKKENTSLSYHKLLCMASRQQISTTHFCAVLLFLVEITGPIQITVTLLQSMHGALPGELGPHSFSTNKKAPHISV